MIARYDIVSSDVGVMSPTEHGGWVRYEEYRKLQEAYHKKCNPEKTARQMAEDFFIVHD